VKRGFTKHMIRLRKPGAVWFGEALPEVVLLNAHDGTSSYQMFHGIFRTICGTEFMNEAYAWNAAMF
jgi:hypothetical protein